MVYVPPEREKFKIYNNSTIFLAEIEGEERAFRLQGDNRGGFYIIPMKQDGNPLFTAQQILQAGLSSPESQYRVRMQMALESVGLTAGIIGFNNFGQIEQEEMLKAVNNAKVKKKDGSLIKA